MLTMMTMTGVYLITSAARARCHGMSTSPLTSCLVKPASIILELIRLQCT